MSKHKLTPWFPGYLKPVHVGVYERNYGEKLNPDLVYSKWDGHQWMAYGDDVDFADKQTCPTLHQCEEWRGIQK